MHLNSAIWLEHPKSFHSFQGNNVKDGTMDDQQIRLTERDLAWLAGTWEADGSFSLNECINQSKYTQYQVNMQYVNTDIELAAEVMGILRKMQVGYYQLSRIQTGFGTKMKHEVRVSGFKRCDRFLTQLIPYLRGQKKRRAEIILEFIHERLSKPKCTRYGDAERNIADRYLSEISTTNMQSAEKSVKIESELHRKMQSGSHEASHLPN
jgi:hypothetical protein